MRLRLVLLILFVCCGSSFTHSNSHVHSQTSNELTITENAYLNWLRHMGSRNHSIFEEAKNQFKPCKRIKVHKDPRFGNYTTVQMAINAIPIKNKCRVLISVGEGTYREKILIPSTMAYVSLVGAGANKTIIQWDDTADKKGENGKPLSTYNSATFAINAPFFVAKHITFENTAEPPALGVFDKQAVALRISGDTATFIGCKFIGSQDTLYDQSGRHYFRNCYIEGSVDFIFGDGLSLYENCHIHADARNDSYAALTAQSRESMLEETGFSFVHCKVTGSGPLYLGRAWGTFSRVVFAYTYMDKFVTPRGWFNWGDKNREMTVFYGEFKCSGPGANNGGRVSWSRELTPEEAAPFISLSFIDGHEWIADL